MAEPGAYELIGRRDDHEAIDGMLARQRVQNLLEKIAGGIRDSSIPAKDLLAGSLAAGATLDEYESLPWELRGSVCEDLLRTGEAYAENGGNAMAYYLGAFAAMAVRSQETPEPHNLS